MSREELLELASLDAFGLLDEYETALFTRSFHHAPAAVQDEIKRLQATFAADQSLLPAVEPPAALRERVLGAVAKAIESESLELAPLAMIGLGGRGGRPELRERASSIGLGNSGTFWRAAAFVLASALIVVLLFGAQHDQPNDKLMDLTIDLLARPQLRAILDLETPEDLKALLDREVRQNLVGTDLLEFVDNPRCRTLALRPLDPGGTAGGTPVDAQAIVFFNDTTGQAFLLAFHLPQATSGTSIKYTVSATAPDGSRHMTRTFAPRHSICGVNLGRVSAELIATLTFTISDPNAGPLLRG